MATWLFQGNPDRFDLDGYLAADLETIRWLVRQHRDQVSVGDTVFVWRSLGGEKGVSGVVAECRVASSVAIQPEDSASKPFWLGDETPKPEPRVELLVIRVARIKEVLKRDWLKADPVLSDLPIFKMAQGTNYAVPERMAHRLRTLWDRTGKDWSWGDSVAGLWAFVETKGSEVSKLPGSPVARVALATGRAIGGVYNKVMNFRAIDPTDKRAGLPGAGDTDREVWQRFFDLGTGQIDRSLLNAEVVRLGLDLSGAPPMGLAGPQNEGVVTGALDALMKRYQRALAAGVFQVRPPTAITSTQTFVRNPLVAEIARLRASSKCEVPGCTVPTFIADSDSTFCEVHHVTPLSEGGDDSIENAICLCPVHHREAHHGKERKSLRAAMNKVRAGG